MAEVMFKSWPWEEISVAGRAYLPSIHDSCVAFLIPNKDGTDFIDLMHNRVKPEIRNFSRVRVLRSIEYPELVGREVIVYNRDDTTADIFCFKSNLQEVHVQGFSLEDLELVEDVKSSAPVIDATMPVNDAPKNEPKKDSKRKFIKMVDLEFETVTVPNPDCPICNGKGYYWSMHNPLIHEFLGGIPYQCKCSMEKIICKQFPDDEVTIEQGRLDHEIKLRIGQHSSYVFDAKNRPKNAEDFLRTWNLKDGLRRLGYEVKD